jgi:RNA polymerase sigma factor (sigma-70 family)
MATDQVNDVVHHLRRVALLREDDVTADGQLLECFITARDQAAFAALVRRHGPMVLGVCRRVLGNHHDAEDAFQAAFLALARKAASLRQRELVANWLHGAAYRAALEAKTTRRRVRERQVDTMPERAAVVEAEVWLDLRPVLDQELARLPDRYRVAVILCDLEGKTRRQAARQLGIAVGTLSGRLTTARRRLARQLARHGLALSVGTLAAALSQRAATAGVPAPLVVSTVQAAALSAAGKAAVAGAISARVATLTEGVLKTMLLSKLKMTLLVLTLVLVAGMGLLTYQALATAHEGNSSRSPAPRLAPPRIAGQAAVPAPAPQQFEITWKEGLILKPQWNKGDQVFCADFSPDGKAIATGQSSGLKILDAATGQELVSQPGLKVTNCLAYSPDGKTLASGHLDGGSLNLLDAATGQVQTALKVPSNVTCLAFSPDGKTLATADRTIRLWDLTTTKEIRQFSSPDPRQHSVYSLAFSRDGKKLASAEGSDKTVKVWDVASGKELATFRGHTEFVIAVAFSPDGKSVASAGGEKIVKVWDLATGKERLSLQGPVSGFRGLAFSPDGRLLASAGGGDKTVQVWDTTTGKPLTTLAAHTKQVWTVAFTRDGQRLVTAGDDAVRLWEAEKQPAKNR